MYHIVSINGMKPQPHSTEIEDSPLGHSWKSDIEVLNFNIVVLNFDICVLNARPGAGDRVHRARRRTAAARAARYRKKG